MFSILFKWLKNILISAFIVANVIVIVFGSLPDRSAVGNRIFNWVRPYQELFALYQAWSMFAPNPSSLNSYIDVELTFADGSKEKWNFPRSSQLGTAERLVSGERFRKFAQDNLIPMEKEDVWIDLGKYVAREVSRLEDEGKHRSLERMDFYRHTNRIQPPTKVFVPHGQLSREFSEELVFHFKPDSKVKYEARNNN
ncbi:hypothetical protein [Bdellovibrio svalbardensis]|uniref:LPS export ABC transporter periplasmic protein LptC n=1 Tax=Bdellovibrio svalbardensis TaxID=2972972 RepID=A0ABT6DGZ9_9BACT|nr:hypothetical protein [Bdellovibrio svalbardensis]MDG0815747.1 hypothetical protein [Bdellovibrio svalbardensis]